MNILIVDDQEENLYLLEALLTGNGHAVRRARNGADALEQLKAGDIELVISDILMPIMDGFEFCRRVRKDEAIRHIPFIIYTATYTGSNDEALALKIGADRFIVKPCDPDVFMEAVREVTDPDRILGSEEAQPPREEEILILYNERLVRKLEQKMTQLEAETKELREVQESLRVSAGKYRRLHESMRDGFVFHDMEGVIQETNESFREMVGYTEAELSRMTYLDLTPEKWHGIELEIVKKQIVVKHFSSVYEKEYIKKDGTVIPIELRTFLLLDEKGGKEGMWAIVRDLSERREAEKRQKELESQLYQAQKMESVGRLAGGVAHDFNNLLTIILGYAEIVLGGMGEADPRHALMTQIYQAGVRASNLTRQLLAFSRKQVLEIKIVDINQVVTGFEKLLRRLIGEDIATTIALAPVALPARADISQLEQVLMNLAVNARDAMPQGGALSIATMPCVMDEDSVKTLPGLLPGSYVVIEVKDTGCGMDKHILEHIFEPFFTTKEMGKGTGLGLATCYGIVKQHHGYIQAESSPGKGTAFRVYLPSCAEKEEAQAIQENRPQPVSGSATVLIVEDDPSVLNLAVQILASQGYTVITASGATDAIVRAAAQRGPLHLVLSDVVLPKMNGPAAFAEIQKLHPEARVLYMSGYPDNAILHRGVLKKGVQYIQKPLTISKLLEKCRQTLNDE